MSDADRRSDRSKTQLARRQSSSSGATQERGTFPLNGLIGITRRGVWVRQRELTDRYALDLTLDQRRLEWDQQAVSGLVTAAEGGLCASVVPIRL